MSNKFHALAVRLQHRDPGSAAITSTAVVETINQRTAGRTDYLTKIYIEAMDIAGNDELYAFVIEVSDDNFSNVREVAAMRDFGATEVRQSGAPDTLVGDNIEMFWSTEVNGVVYQDWRLKVFISGAGSETITFHAYSSILV